MYPKTELKNLISINPDSIKGKFPFSEIEYIDISSVGIGQLLSITKINSCDAPGRAKRLVKVGDTILSTVRPNRKSYFFIKETKPNLVISTGFAVLRPKPILDSRFLYQNINLQSFTDFLSNNAKGAAYPAIDVDTVKRASIYFPKLIIQQKIASILSAYDDLIENNNKRIKILEEIVLSIYKKLFQGKTENGFIKNLYSLLPGYAFKSKDFADEGDAIVKIRNINEEGMVDTENVDLIPSEITQKVEKFKLNSGDILIAMTGATIGKTGIVPILEKNTFLNQRVGKFISKKSPVYISYIASYSRMSSFRKKIEAVAMGAAQPNISGSIIENFSMYIPTETELDYFCNTTEKFYREMLILRHKNTILKRIKNLLLPKLISGELDVEGLDIKIRPEIL